MKKFILLVVAVSTLSFGVTSCNDDEENNNPNKKEQQNTDSIPFVGQLSVTYKGEEVTTDDVKVSAVATNNVVSLYFFRVKFVPQMPVTIDLVVPEIPSNTTDGNIVFQSDSIVPTMGGAKYEQYVAKQITGTITNGTINFSLTFGGMPTKYSGVVKE